MQEFDFLSSSVVCCHFQGVFIFLFVSVNIDGNVAWRYLSFSTDFVKPYCCISFIYFPLGVSECIELFMPVGHLET